MNWTVGRGDEGRGTSRQRWRLCLYSSLVPPPSSLDQTLFRVLVVPKPEEYRLPQQPVPRDLLVPYLRHELRLYPVTLRLGRHRAFEGRRRGGEPLQLRRDLFELFGVEPAPRPPCVDEFAIRVAAEMERAESAAAPLGSGVAHDDEVPGLVGANLQPVVRATALVGRIGFLGDDAFESQPHRLIVQRLAVFLEMSRIAQRARLRQHFLEQRLPFHQRQRTQVEPFERNEIEQIHGARGFDRRVTDIGHARDAGAVLESLEARTSGIVQDHELAIHDQPVVRQRVHGARELGERRRVIVAVAGDEPGAAALPNHPHAVPVELELEQPPGASERLLTRLGQHRRHVFRLHHALRRLETFQLGAQLRRLVRTVFQLLDRQPGQHRSRREIVAVGRRHTRRAP